MVGPSASGDVPSDLYVPPISSLPVVEVTDLDADGDYDQADIDKAMEACAPGCNLTMGGHFDHAIYVSNLKLSARASKSMAGAYDSEGGIYMNGNSGQPYAHIVDRSSIVMQNFRRDVVAE